MRVIAGLSEQAVAELKLHFTGNSYQFIYRNLSLVMFTFFEMKVNVKFV